jgi:hypothetical protein
MLGLQKNLFAFQLAFYSTAYILALNYYNNEIC